MIKTNSPKYRWVILVVCFLTLTCGYIYVSLWSMILPELMEEFHVSSATAQLGNSLLLAGYAVASFVLAQLAGKIGRKWASAVGLLLFSAATFIIPLCSSFPLILCLRFVQGWGIVWGLNVGLAAAWCPAKSRGFASGLVGGGLCTGVGFGGWYASMLWDHFPNWRDCFFNGGYLMLLFVVLFLIFAKDPPKNLYPEETQQAESSESTKLQGSVWKYPGLWLCAAALFFTCWPCLAFQTVLPDYCYGLGYTMEQAGNALLVMGLLGIVLTPLGGMLSDVFVKRGVPAMKARGLCMAFAGYLPTVVVLVLCPFTASAGFAVIYALAIVQSTCAPVCNASIGALPMDMLGDPVQADKMFGVTILFGLFGGVISPYVVSAVQNAMGWTAAWFVGALGAVIGVIISLAVCRFGQKK